MYWDDKTISYLVKKGYSTKFGARNLRRLIQREIEDVLAEMIISNYTSEILGFSLSADDEKIKVSFI